MKPNFAWCYHHHEYEDASGEIYRMCGECGHVYRTGADLVNAYNAESQYMAMHWAEMLISDEPPPMRDLTPEQADVIGFCQFCLHDW